MPVFRGQTATLQLGSVTVGVLQDAEISIEFTDEELRGQSLKRVDIMRTELNITVNATYGSFDLAGIKDLIGYDDGNNEIEDTPQPPSFTVTGNFVSADGSEDFDIDLQEVIFDNVSLTWDGDTHVTEDLSGTATDLSITDNTA